MTVDAAEIFGPALPAAAREPWQRSDRAGWLAVVEKATAEHREERAKHHERAASRARRAGDEVGARYHAGRADGQRERFDRVRGCAKTLGVIKTACRGCGIVHELPARCDAAWLCVGCRSELKKSERKRFGLARSNALKTVLQMGLHRHDRKGGRWSDKFLTLTVPHSGFDDRTGRFFVLPAEERVRLRDEAFPKFIREVRKFWRARCGREARFVAWQRRYEWTPGSDGLGHPHVHMWLLCPFLPQEMLHEWWYRALANVGWRGGRNILYPDVREVRGEELARELIKYITKDIVSAEALAAPETYATAYKLHDAKRRTQSSRGLMKHIPRTAPCGECHENAGHDVEYDRGAVSFARSNVVPLQRERPPP